MRVALLSLIVVLSGCTISMPNFTPMASGPVSAPSAAHSTSAPVQRGGLILQPGGLGIAGSDGLEVGFGRAMPGTVEAVRRVAGAPLGDPETNEECGAGPMSFVRYGNGLTLNFLNGAFVGWTADAAAAGATAGGARVGAAPGTAVLTQTSLGTEVELDGVFGILDEAGELRLLYAGTTCFFR